MPSKRAMEIFTQGLGAAAVKGFGKKKKNKGAGAGGGKAQPTNSSSNFMNSGKG